MILLVCRCLNVQIHGQGNTFNREDPRSLNLPENLLNDPFCENQVYSVTLDLAGITVSQRAICKIRSVGNWSITNCSCCTLDVFASDNDRVLVTSRVETNPHFISSLMDLERYSSLFKLILPEINDNFIQNNFGIGFQNRNIDHSIEIVQNQVSTYLRNEQRLMEDRIRQYTEEQQATYTRLLQKVRKHKQAMVYLMVKCNESESQSKEDPGSSRSFSTPLKIDTVNESSINSAFDTIETAAPVHEGRERRRRSTWTLRRTVSNPAKPKLKVKREFRQPSASIDVGGVFDMEDFDTTEYFSCESDGDNYESENEEPSNEESTCATSLPLSIPAFSSLPHLPVIDDEAEKEPVPDDIAASIRALAFSVRDGTEMFGELPRRRLNTGELLASRPN